MPPGVDVHRFTPGGSDARAVEHYRSELGLGPVEIRDVGRRVVIAMAGRLSREKNWDDYLLVARRLKDILRDRVLCLGIAGDPHRVGRSQTNALKDLDKFNRRIGSPVQFAWMVPDWEHILAGVDVYLHTAPSESFCRTAAEAVSCGVPVVGIKAGGIGELVIRDGAGFGVRPDGGDGWCRRLTDTERDGLVSWTCWYINHGRPAREAVRRYAIDNLDDDRTHRQYAELAAELMGEKNHG